MKTTKKILIITHHRPNRSPGQRFRFEQYLQWLEQQGFSFEWDILLNEKDDKIFYGNNILKKISLIITTFFRRVKTLTKTSKYHGILIYREAYIIGGAFFEKLIARQNPNIWFDFDDAIWLPNVSEKNKKWAWLKRPQKTKNIIRLSKIITCGNDYLTGYAQQYNPDSITIPTTIDTNYHTVKVSNASNVVTVGWTGSSTTLPYFEKLLPVLSQLKAKYGNKIDFKIIVDVIKNYPEINAQTSEWRLEKEISDLHTIDIGIMPLPNDEWSKGKCGFKILQYMAIGIPAIASPVGANNNIINHGKNGFLANSPNEWLKYLSDLIENESLRKKIGTAGRKTVEEKYSVEANKHKYLNVLNSLCTD